MSSWTVTYALPAPVFFPVKYRCAPMARSYCVRIGRFAPKAELFFYRWVSNLNLQFTFFVWTINTVDYFTFIWYNHFIKMNYWSGHI